MIRRHAGLDGRQFIVLVRDDLDDLARIIHGGVDFLEVSGD